MRYILRAKFTRETGLHYSHDLYVPWLERELKLTEKGAKRSVLANPEYVKLKQ